MVCIAKAASPAWHQPFLKMLPRIKTHARIAFRGLSPDTRAECVQETICHALKAYVRLWELGRTNIAYPTTLARYGVCRTKEGRKVGGHLNVNDPLSSYCQAKNGVQVERLDHYDTEEDAWTQAIVEDRTAGPAEVARVRIDFAAFLRSLPLRVRRIAKFLANGETTNATAEKFNVSAGRISQIRKELRLAWAAFCGDAAAA